MLKAALASIVLAALSVTSALGIHPSALRGAQPERLRSTAALPAHVAGSFKDIAACHLSPEGDYLVFDRRAHAVFNVAGSAAPKKIIEIGVEAGRILRPLAFDSALDGTFVIADAPTGIERIQIFFYLGGTISGFTLPGRNIPRIVLDEFVLSGIGSLDYTGSTILVSQPDTGALISEYGVDGRTLRSFGGLRATGHESDRDLHLALNAGIPLAIPDKGGFYFVFLGGIPVFRKYDAGGKLLFERHIEGMELDGHILTLPSHWPKRRTAAGEFPIVPPTVRAAAVDPQGRLWVSLVTPHTYVYDTSGDKARTIVFHAAGVMTPSNFHFIRDGRLLVAPGCYTFNWR
ncbi:MAG TPA: hypothetical protein VJ813_05600 [Vicinamibacterales bacterium]|nr:hypothetical protein [Vicinamibacterales bacterium]